MWPSREEVSAIGWVLRTSHRVPVWFLFSWKNEMLWLVTDLWLFHRSECKALHRLCFSKSHHSTTFWGLPFLTLFQCKFTDENSNVLVHCHWIYSVPLLITVDLAMKSSGSSSSSFREQLSCVVELKIKFPPWVTLRKAISTTCCSHSFPESSMLQRIRMEY